jgi:long-chain acyl-CoA synthetase
MTQVTRLFDFPYQQDKYQSIPDALNTNRMVFENVYTRIYSSNAVSESLLRMGIKKNDKIAVISSSNRTEWNIMDIGIQTGAQTSHLPNNSEDDYEYILKPLRAIYCFI